MTRLARGIALAVSGAALVSCGGRTGLSATLPADAGAPVPDAGSSGRFDAGADAPPAVDVFVAPPVCGAAAAHARAGRVLWETTLATDKNLVGPMAAGTNGDTFFVDDGFDTGAIVKGGSTVIALDSCGRVRWKAAWDHFYNDTVATYLLVSGSRVIALNADVQAFDVATGAHLWTADVIAFGKSAGLGDFSGSDSLSTPVATADGRVYVTAYSPGATWLLAIDETGAPSAVARVPTESGGGATDVIVDREGRLDVSVVFTNTTPGPGNVVSFERNGSIAWTSPALQGLSYQNRLMSSSSFVLSGSDATPLGFDGSIMARLGDAGTFGGGLAQPAVVDSAGAIYAISAVSSAGITFSAWNADLSPRWTSVLAANVFYEYTGGPLAGDGAHVYELLQVATTEGPGATTVLALDPRSGAIEAWPFPEPSSGYALLVAPGELVFTLGKRAVAVSTGGEGPADSVWPTPRGGLDQRGVARGQ